MFLVLALEHFILAELVLTVSMTHRKYHGSCYFLPRCICSNRLTQTIDAQAETKWQGKTSAELKSFPAQQVWPFLADFCNIHKVLPGLETCYQVEEVPGQLGITRYCATPATDDDESTVLWVKEKLIAIDPIKLCLSYEVLENNMGFKSYIATMQVIPLINNDEGCMMEWSFVCDPIESWGLEDFRSYMESSLQGMAKKIEDALLSSTNATV